MAKVQLLLDVIQDIRSLADSLESVADAMTRSGDAVTEQKASQPTTAVESGTVVEKPIQKEELRAFLGEKSLAGHREAIHTIICKYGVQKFSDVDPKYYPAIKKEAEALPDAT